MEVKERDLRARINRLLAKDGKKVVININGLKDGEHQGCGKYLVRDDTGKVIDYAANANYSEWLWNFAMGLGVCRYGETLSKESF